MAIQKNIRVTQKNNNKKKRIRITPRGKGRSAYYLIVNENEIKPFSNKKGTIILDIDKEKASKPFSNKKGTAMFDSDKEEK